MFKAPSSFLIFSLSFCFSVFYTWAGYSSASIYTAGGSVFVSGGEVGGGGGEVGGGGGEVGGGGGVNQANGDHYFLKFENEIVELVYQLKKIPQPINRDIFGLLPGKGNLENRFREFQRKLIGADKYLSRAYKGENQSVVIIDSGISGDFRGMKQVKAFLDYVGNCNLNRPCDGNSHGTIVADLIHQTAPEANLYVHRVLSPNGSGDTDDVVSAIQWAIDNQKRLNIRVINLSLQAPVMSRSVEYPDSWRHELKSMIQLANDKGILVVTSSGNYGDSNYSSMPGNSTAAFTVGSIDHHFSLNAHDHTVSQFTKMDFAFDSVVERGVFSSRLYKDNFTSKPDLLAPGSFIVAQIDIASLVHKNLSLDGTRIINEKFAMLSGTSFASAQVAGLALLIQQEKDFANVEDLKSFLLMNTRAPYVSLKGRNQKTIGTIFMENQP